MEEQESNGGHNPIGYFTQGANVEVCSKEKGSEGAWFPATILEPPANSSASKRKTFTSNKVLIQYKTLVSDKDPTKPLVEHTTVGLLRQPPPADNAEEERFEENDVVDAFHLEGWWTGLVMSVVGEKYGVGFKKPPDYLELERSKLRSHWDWDHGVWTRAPRQVLRGSNYKPWTPVEVNLEKDHLWSSWLPAFFIGQVGGDSFLVQYKYKTPENDDKNGLVKVVVADHQIRPRPPQQEEKDFHLSQMVDAFCDMGWWVGDITEVLTDKRYVVTFRFTKEEKEFCHPELRCHLEWIGKQWVTSDSEFHSTKYCGVQPRHAREISSNSVGKTPCHTKFRMKKLSPCMDKLPCERTKDKLKISQHPSDDSTFLSPTPCKKLKGEDSEDTLSLAQSYQRKTPAKTSKRKGLFTDEETNEQQQFEQLDSLAINFVKRGRQPNSQFVKRGRKGIPRKLHVSNGSKSVRGDQEYIEDENVMTRIESFGIPSEPEAIGGLHAGNSCLLPVKEIKHGNEDKVSSGIKQAELLVQHPKDPAAGCMNDILEKPANPSGNQNLATYQRKKRFKLTGVKHNGTGVFSDAEVSKTNVVEHIGNPAGTVNQQEKSLNLPFVKNSPLWEHLESMEVFKNFPQKPHFHFAVNLNPVFREGAAIGSMLAFASLVEKISNLGVDDPRELIESYLKGLVEMELMGFDVKAPRHRLTKLLDMKIKLGQLQKQSKEVKLRITGSTHDTTTYNETITGIDKKIKDLQEKRMMAVSMKEVKVSEISRLQAEATVINEDIQSIRCDFGNLVAAEW
ncbi:putative Agenet-like domain-containing protein [Rosa chinensis]|uniref:Putative Agenet-like domain-containing protein n=1 Tax=Rosa chinensis TaxID=74649 RepID=A0A2P6SM04_ROSCH|nr:DUF724 domain-containing protein 6 isoform X1 [Rosa chinensis]PRQ59699.1 putative Agenet-like domain-containing protein [Rosa chinensis]